MNMAQDGPEAGGGLLSGKYPPKDAIINPKANLPYAKKGLLLAPIGSKHMAKVPSGKMVHMTVARLDDLPDEIANKKNSVVCRCLTCGKDYPTLKELNTTHPNAKLVKMGEIHVWAYWCAEAKSKETWEKDVSPLMGLDGRNIIANPAASAEVWGLLSDEDAIDQVRGTAL
jgi:hypothetical protein